MHLRKPLLFSVLLLSTAACASAGVTGDAAASGRGASAASGTERERTARFEHAELVNTGGWTLQSANAAGAEIAEVRAPGIAFEMRFSGDEVSASGGCNQLRGNFTAGRKRLEMTLAIATRMSCTDDKNLADRRFSEMMSGAFKAELLQPQPYRLRLTSDSGDVFVFQAKPIQL
jgi:heat shock protein HslJ